MKTIKLLFLFIVLTSAIESYAVAFKVKNDSDHTFRVRIHDRGSWRPWVICHPGFWGDVAKSVERAEHMVEIQVHNGNYWEDFYYKSHGSVLFTRVIQFASNYSQIGITWWDEPNFCRGQPPYPGSGEGSCLILSGWVERMFIDGIEWAVEEVFSM